MNKIENISVTVMEECAEVQQAISKSLRFGYDCCNPANPDTNNAKDILTEYYQLQAMMELLISESGLDKYCSDEEITQIKNNKVKKFLEYYKTSKDIENVENKKCEHEWELLKIFHDRFYPIHYYECSKCGETHSISSGI